MRSPKNLLRAPRFSRPVPMSALAILLALSAPLYAEDGLTGSLCGNATSENYRCGEDINTPDSFDPAAASGQSVTLTGDAGTSSNVYGAFNSGGVAGAVSEDGVWVRRAQDNTVNIDTSGSVYSAFGGDVYFLEQKGDGVVKGNQVNFTQGTAKGGVYGGRAQSELGASRAEGNRVVISGGEVAYEAAGAYSESQGEGASLALDNHLVLSGDAQVNTSKSASAYGGQARSAEGHASARGNTAALSDTVSVKGDFSGGYAVGNSATVSGNRATISGGTVSGKTQGAYAESNGKEGMALALDNQLTLSGNAGIGEDDWASSAYGGQAISHEWKAEAHENTLTIGDEEAGGGGKVSVGENLYGAYAEAGQEISSDEEYRRAISSAGTGTAPPEGGQAAASGNTVWIQGDAEESVSAKEVYGAYVYASQRIHYTELPEEDALAEGGRATASRNTVTIRGGGEGRSVVLESVYGGYAEGLQGLSLFIPADNNDQEGDADAQEVAPAPVESNMPLLVGLAQGGQATASFNTVEILGGEEIVSVVVTESVYGGYAQGGQDISASTEERGLGSDPTTSETGGVGQALATGNTVKISGSEVGGAIYGGYANGGNAKASSPEPLSAIPGRGPAPPPEPVDEPASGGKATATWNTVEISGSEVGGEIYGGYANGGARVEHSVPESFSLAPSTGSSSPEAPTEFAGSEATASHNTLTIFSSQSKARVFGGKAEGEKAEANANIVTIRAGESEGASLGQVCGGCAESSSEYADLVASGNTVTISGSAMEDSLRVNGVYGGYVSHTPTTMEWHERASSAANAQALAAGNTVTFSGETAKVSNYLIGGYAQSVFATATGNTIDITGATVESGRGYRAAAPTNTTSGVVGGVALGDQEAKASSNTTRLSGGTLGVDLAGGYAVSSQGHAWAGDTSENSNTLFITSSTIENERIAGGYAQAALSATARYNTVTIGGESVIASTIYGGFAQSETEAGAFATHNTLTISGAPDLSGATLYGGSIGTSEGSELDEFTGNTLNLKTSANLTVGALHNFEALNFELPMDLNTETALLTVLGETVALHGMRSDGSKASSQISISLGENQNVAPGNWVHLLKASDLEVGDALAEERSAHTDPVSGLTTEWVFSTGVEQNTLSAFLKRLEATDLVRTEALKVASAPNEGVILKVGGRLDIEGGLTVNNAAGGGVSIDIHEINATGKPVAVFLEDTQAWNETAEYQGVLFRALKLGNGNTFALSGNGGYRVDNYEIHGQATFKAENDAVFAAENSTLRFVLSEATQNASTMLSVEGGEARIGGAHIALGIEGAESSLRPGDYITLIDASRNSVLVGEPANTQAEASVDFLNYQFAISAETSLPGAPARRAFGSKFLIGTLTGIRASDASQSLATGSLAASALLAQGSGFITQQGIQAALAAQHSELYRPRIFAALGGSQLKYGKHAFEVDGHVLAGGAATSVATAAGDATFAAFIEHGEGDYESSQRFVSGKVKGSGKTRYSGGGLIARLDTPGKAYFEGSLKGGAVNTDARLQDANGRPTRYDTHSGYIGAHAGIGKLWQLNAQNGLDTYTQILWTRQDKDKVRLSPTVRLAFDALDSKRLKIGARLNHAFSNTLTGFAGLAYDHEFSSQAKARLERAGVDYPIPASHFKGSTTLIEAGLSGRPTPKHPLYIDLAIQAHTGKREGISANVRVNYHF